MAGIKSIDPMDEGKEEWEKILHLTDLMSVTPFLYLVVINGQIRTVGHKCKSAGKKIKHF